MFDESAFINRVETAEPPEFALLMEHPSVDEERTLRRYFGEERYRRLHALALRTATATRGGDDRPRPNVVVIPGVMGSELESIDREGDRDHLWVSPLRLLTGGLSRLRLAEDGRSEADTTYDVRTMGIMKRYYGELLLTLNSHANVRAFWYDWRKDLSTAADDLRAQTTSWFGDQETFHIVAHSLGGLVARTFIMNHTERWTAMPDPPGRLIMLGTPNHGALGTIRAMKGDDNLVRKLGWIDRFNGLSGLLGILNSFPATYQMLPSPFALPAMDRLYDQATWNDSSISQAHLDNAREHHRRLNTLNTAKKPRGRLKLTADSTRMVYIAGYGRPTITAVDLAKSPDKEPVYTVTTAGDGRVSHELGALCAAGQPPVTMLFVDEEHARLSVNDSVLRALARLLDPDQDLQHLEQGLPPGLSLTVPADRSSVSTGSENGPLGVDPETKRHIDRLVADLETQATATSLTRGASDRGTKSAPTRTVPMRTVSAVERQLSDLLLQEVVADRKPAAQSIDSRAQLIDRDMKETDKKEPQFDIEIALVYGGIEAIPSDWSTKPPVDAIAVGHYSGGRPQSAELALDKAITAELSGRSQSAPEDRILTQFSDRGILPGEIGRFFFLADPRDAQGQRSIAIAGMGPFGRFGVPELIVLVRELCWTLATLGKRHLATTLIGAGNRNLSTADAVYAWTRGIRGALQGRRDPSCPTLEKITFVNTNAMQVLEINRILLREKAVLENGGQLSICYTEIGQDQRKCLVDAAIARERSQVEERLRRQIEEPQTDERRSEPQPTHMTLEYDETGYRFGVITETASVPERVTQIDADIVVTANLELALEEDVHNQLDRGQFLNRLLFPAELSNALATDTPLVMMLDTNTATIHWEMVAQPDQYAPDPRDIHDAGTASEPIATAGHDDETLGRFLGTARGFTRQLRTTFAPPPELPPPPQRTLRVLVVGDPAPDARLPGAETEAITVADLFERYNDVAARNDGSLRNSVSVTRLLGPTDATRTNVLRELLNNRYDVLHFAGHCFFDPLDPTACGWLFQQQPRKFISAKELSRIDRVPKFVFSNACESGVLPDRNARIYAGIGPSFAEAFFKQGVANLICTAWKVNDDAATVFARTLYAQLLGLKADSERPVDLMQPEYIWCAMREARRVTAKEPGGARTWGAYQHYGSPYYTFFARRSRSEDVDA
jgi:pimeloyl-ACP methyl ester carboxylesterase